MITLYSTNTNNYEKTHSHHNFGKHDRDIDFKLFEDNNLPNRQYKILPHLHIHAGICVYCDANMTLEQPEELLRLCKNLENSEFSSIFFKHPDRTTVRQEVVECIKRGLLPSKSLEQYNKWRRDGFNDDIQLMENNVVIRKTFDEDLIRCEEVWYNEYEKGMLRDQPSLPYAMWKTGYKNFILMEQQVKETIFKWRPHKS